MAYWTKRAESFSDERRKELRGALGERWDKALVDALGAEDLAGQKILDAGCGSGELAILLARHGCKVTGIDLTPAMIKEARALAAEEGLDITFEVMDAQDPDLPANSFDYVISRNLTWTLTNVEKAYTSWHRLLRDGGKMVNFDANYGQMTRELQMDGAADEMPGYEHKAVLEELFEEHKAITEFLKISREDRPRWDLMTLMRIGYRECGVDVGAGSRIYEDEHDPGSAVFMVQATK